MKKNIVCILVIMIIFVICIEHMVKIYRVVYTDNIEEEYEHMIDKNNGFDYILVSNQAVTEGTDFCIEECTNKEINISENKDIILENWINPNLLKINDNFILSGNAKYIIEIKKDDNIKKINKYNEEVMVVKPRKVTILTNSSIVYNAAVNENFYVKDLSLRGHISFYLGKLFPDLRRSI